ncbi:MAG TPA: BON domain-containing protein [Gaiellaceae bacterium]|nr:BON domain-containing protein [Gaiellaceae bacterium]
MRTKAAFLLGAGAAYLLDPRQGRRRRHVLRDRSLGTARRTVRAGVRRARFAAGHLRGLLAVVRRLVPRPRVATDDATVEQRIRSDALRDVGLSAKDVEVHVEDGVATLLGTVATRERLEGLVRRVRKVPGVADVVSLLRVASETRAA